MERISLKYRETENINSELINKLEKTDDRVFEMILEVK
jgi:hypothetical protein